MILLNVLLAAGQHRLYAQTNGTVRFNQNYPWVRENLGPSRLYDILEWVDLRGPAGVTLQVTGGTAQEGVDFTFGSKVLLASPESADDDVVITPVNDGKNEGQETIELTLTNPTGGIVIGSPNRITISLFDDPTATSFYLDPLDSPTVVWKSTGEVTLGIMRRGTMTDGAQVDYQTEPGTAKPGVDYLPVSGTLHFPPSQGEGYRLNFTIPILTNNPPGGDREFRVTVSNPSAGHILGDPKVVTVHILNDGAGFALQPQLGTNEVYELAENAGQALVDVVILGDTVTRPVSVQYRTEPVSATPVEDYTPVTGTLTFAAGENRKTITIPITNDSRTEGASDYYAVQSFTLLLENPTGGLPLSRPREVELRIRDNDRGYSIASADSSQRLYLDERSGAVAVNVSRQGDYNFSSSVHYRLATKSEWLGLGAAAADVDFLPTEGTLTFAANETNKTFTITILDDSLIEGDEECLIVLDQATGGVPIATPEVRVIIRDNERNPVRVDPDFKPDWPLSFADTVLSADGKILLVTPSDPITGQRGDLVVRLLSDGQVDREWHAAAIAPYVNCLASLPDGKVLVAAAGNSLEYPWYTTPDPQFTVNGVACVHLVRLNRDGSLDTGFSAQMPTNMIVKALAVQSDGKILVSIGNWWSQNSPGTNVIIRLNPTGSVDPGFRPFPGPTDQILLAPDNAIFIALWGPGALWRLNSDGTQDQNFHAPEDSYFRAMQPDGRLLVAFYGAGTPMLVRLTGDGQADPTFSPVTGPHLVQVLPTAEGKIWILDSLNYDTSEYLVRVNADGIRDPSWPVAGINYDALFSLYGGRALELREADDGNLLALMRDGWINGQLRRGLSRLLVHAPLPRFEVDPSTALVPEDGGKVPIKLLRGGTNSEPIVVNWRTEGGNAQPGVDYVAASGTLTFPANQSVATLEIEVLDNALPDENRTLRLYLQGPPPDPTDYPAVEITIINDDLGFLPDGIKPLPNGQMLLRLTGYSVESYLPDPFSDKGPFLEARSRVETSENLLNWAAPDLDAPRSDVRSGHREVIDRTASTNAVRFYRLRKDYP